MSLNWQNLRAWDGSQQTAFEELCCQIAQGIPVPSGSVFVRKGTPDAGVECYWRLPGNEEWAWQAKYFRTTPGPTQWRQIDDSVGTALRKHPALTVYTVCLPLDRSDPRHTDQTSFMAQWDAHVLKWQGWAREQGRVVAFRYWGEHEIWYELSREDNRGRQLFWFNEEVFSDSWFRRRLEETVAQAGPRYTPALNVKLPIARVFDGLGWTTAFDHRFQTAQEDLVLAANKILSPQFARRSPAESAQIEQDINNLSIQLKAVQRHPFEMLPLDSLTEAAEKLAELASRCAQLLQPADRREHAAQSSTPLAMDPAKEAPIAPAEDYSYERHHLVQLWRAMHELVSFLNSSEARAANIRVALVVGAAGTGKTHLLCDVAEERLTAHLPTILLLGEQFGTEEPWTQMARLLGIQCTKEEFLGALSAAAEATGARALILLDALNEGDGIRLWPRHLAGMLATIKRYRNLGLAISVRSSYERVIIPKAVNMANLERIEHQGFTGHEESAVARFFGAFGIARPSVPLLAPEFSNPLFLKLFCQGLANRGFVTIPAGLQGITTVFAFFIESVNDVICRPDHVNADPKAGIVDQAITALTARIAERGTAWAPRDEARAVVDAICPREKYEDSLFRHLLSEGVLAEDIFPTNGGGYQEGIRFAYERFADHRIAASLLDTHLKARDPAAAFAPGGALHVIIEDEVACWRRQGIVEALSIQLPERVQMELVEIAPYAASYVPIRNGFLESLIWRKRVAFSDATRRYINSHIIPEETAYRRFLHVLLTVAVLPDHPYNAEQLHAYLMKQTLPERDASWSRFLFEAYEQGGAIERIVEWAWSPDSKRHIEDASIRLCGIALCWFLSTSHRFLRDRATKALVQLLSDRMRVLRQVLEVLRGVNDPYITQRIWAVAYGCALRTSDQQQLGALAEDTFAWVFAAGEPPADLLLRDYARGVIEIAHRQGEARHLDLARVRPPFHATWPTTTPSDEALQDYGHKLAPESDAAIAWHWLCDSVLNDGDFARYVIDPAVRSFFPRPLRDGAIDPDALAPASPDPYTSFLKSLTTRQLQAWEEYHRLRQMELVVTQTELAHLLMATPPEAEFEQSAEEVKRGLALAKRRLERALGNTKRQYLYEAVLPYLERPEQTEPAEYFDTTQARRWILKRVLEMGWTTERFGTFDRHIVWNDGRASHKVERIGKKYQWIALYELLARLVDNFQFAGDRWSSDTHKYDGPWQMIHGRDIDPSWLLKGTPREAYGETTEREKVWWRPSHYDTQASEHHDVEWLRDPEHRPEVEPLLEVTNPADGSRWFVLAADYDWRGRLVKDERGVDMPRRNTWYLLRSYIVRKTDADAFFTWAKAQDFAGRWMPESRHVSDVYLGEFHWASAYMRDDLEADGPDSWIRGDDGGFPCAVLVPTEQYTWDGSDYDCSIDDSIRVDVPGKWLADHLGLHWHACEGEFVDSTGQFLAFDPSVRQPGPGALLIRRDALLHCLEQEECELIWTVLGEKHLLGIDPGSVRAPGYMTISGAYRLDWQKVHGTLSVKLHTRSHGNT